MVTNRRGHSHDHLHHPPCRTDADLAAICRHALLRQGFAVWIAPTSADVLRHLHLEQLDRLILAHPLPNMSGLTLASQVRAFSPVPIMVLTTH